ncbi:MAG: hypothetical protein AAGJ82_10005 [Bacteroidota bacterium]
MKTLIQTLFLLGAISLFTPIDSQANPLDSCPTAACEIKKSFRQAVLQSLRQDGLIAAEAQHVKIEFEYHDIFVNEVILDYELIAKYQALFREYGIAPGPQRQIRLLSNGEIVIGDFGLQNELLTPVELEYVGR